MEKFNNQKERFTVRLDHDMLYNLELFHQATGMSKGKFIRTILKKFFDENDELIEQFYEKSKSKNN